MAISALYWAVLVLGTSGWTATSVALIGESRPSQVAFCALVQLGCLSCVWAALEHFTTG